MNKLQYIAILILLVAFATGCKSSTKDYATYMKYLASESNGVLKTKSTQGLRISFKYLPIDYLAYSEASSSNKTYTKEQIEALKKGYENSLTFLMTFAPDKDKAFDVTKVGISNYEEFSQRIEEMNFNLSNYIKLETEDKVFVPELTQMESLYGLEKKRNILIVFNKKEITDNLRVVYNDQIFGTGIHKFLFKQKDLLSIPQFVF